LTKSQTTASKETPALSSGCVKSREVERLGEPPLTYPQAERSVSEARDLGQSQPSKMSLGEALLIAASLPCLPPSNDPLRGSIRMINLAPGLAFRYRSARPGGRLKTALRAFRPHCDFCPPLHDCIERNTHAVVHLSRGTIPVITCSPGCFAHCVRLLTWG